MPRLDDDGCRLARFRIFIISIDGRRVDPLWLDNGKTCKQKIVGLDLGDSPIENADEVTSFLTQYLPRIQQVPRRYTYSNRPQSYRVGRYRSRWRAVFESLLNSVNNPPSGT